MRAKTLSQPVVKVFIKQHFLPLPTLRVRELDQPLDLGNRESRKALMNFVDAVAEFVTVHDGVRQMRVPRTTDGRIPCRGPARSIRKPSSDMRRRIEFCHILTSLWASKDTDQSLIEPAYSHALHRVGSLDHLLNRIHPLPHRPALPIPIFVGLHFLVTSVFTNDFFHLSTAYSANLIKYIG